LAFGGIVAAGYLAYLPGGASPVGFLPRYFDENFNLGLAHPLFALAKLLQAPGSTLANVITFGGLVVMSLVFVLRPVAPARDALMRCIWLIGWYTLLTQNLFAWYLLWLLPLIALFAEPGQLFGFKSSATTAWLIFSGSIALSYVFFIRWRPVPATQIAEFVPLYALLVLSPAIRGWPVVNRLPALRGESQARPYARRT
jgi:hypothetical protein